MVVFVTVWGLYGSQACTTAALEVVDLCLVRTQPRYITVFSRPSADVASQVRSSNGSYEFIDFRETAPAAAFQDMYNANVNLSLYGGLARRDTESPDRLTGTDSGALAAFPVS